MFSEIKLSPGVGLSLLIGAVGSIYLIFQSHRYFSKLGQRRRSDVKKSDVECYMCNASIAAEDANSFATCRGCERLVCRNEQNTCSEWIPAIGIWECRNCHSSRVIQQKAGEWLLNQLTSRLQKPGPVNLKNENILGLNVLDSEDTSGSTSPISSNQKVKVREFIEELLSTILNGPLDDVSVGQLLQNESYLPLCEGQKEPLSPSDQHFELRKLLQRILEEVAKLPELLNHSGLPLRPEEHLPYFSPKKYEQLLATAVLNKVVEDYRNPKNFEDVEPPKPDSKAGPPSTGANSAGSAPTAGATFDINHNKVPGTGHLSAANLEQMSLDTNEDVLSKRELFSRSLSESDESYLSDYIQKHTVPLPDLSDTTGSASGAEEDLVSLKSNGTDGTWEENWLFRKRQLKATESSIAMLVPSPTEEVKALIGDQNVDEVSDLSEAGSDLGEYDSDSNNRDTTTTSKSSVRNVESMDDAVNDNSLVSISSLPTIELSEAKNSLLLANEPNGTAGEKHFLDDLISIDPMVEQTEASNAALLAERLSPEMDLRLEQVETDDVKLMQERIQNAPKSQDAPGSLHSTTVGRPTNLDGQTAECDRKEIPIDREEDLESITTSAFQSIPSTLDESEYRSIPPQEDSASRSTAAGVDTDTSLGLDSSMSSGIRSITPNEGHPERALAPKPSPDLLEFNADSTGAVYVCNQNEVQFAEQLKGVRQEQQLLEELGNRPASASEKISICQNMIAYNKNAPSPEQFGGKTLPETPPICTTPAIADALLLDVSQNSSEPEAITFDVSLVANIEWTPRNVAELQETNSEMEEETFNRTSENQCSTETLDDLSQLEKVTDASESNTIQHKGVKEQNIVDSIDDQIEFETKASLESSNLRAVSESMASDINQKTEVREECSSHEDQTNPKLEIDINTVQLDETGINPKAIDSQSDEIQKLEEQTISNIEAVETESEMENTIKSNPNTTTLGDSNMDRTESADFQLHLRTGEVELEKEAESETAVSKLVQNQILEKQNTSDKEEEFQSQKQSTYSSELIDLSNTRTTEETDNLESSIHLELKIETSSDLECADQSSIATVNDSEKIDALAELMSTHPSSTGVVDDSEDLKTFRETIYLSSEEHPAQEKHSLTDLVNENRSEIETVQELCKEESCNDEKFDLANEKTLKSNDMNSAQLLDAKQQSLPETKSSNNAALTEIATGTQEGFIDSANVLESMNAEAVKLVKPQETNTSDTKDDQVDLVEATSESESQSDNKELCNTHDSRTNPATMDSDFTHQISHNKLGEKSDDVARLKAQCSTKKEGDSIGTEAVVESIPSEPTQLVVPAEQADIITEECQIEAETKSIASLELSNSELKESNLVEHEEPEEHQRSIQTEKGTILKLAVTHNTENIDSEDSDNKKTDQIQQKLSPDPNIKNHDNLLSGRTEQSSNSNVSISEAPLTVATSAHEDIPTELLPNIEDHQVESVQTLTDQHENAPLVEDTSSSIEEQKNEIDVDVSLLEVEEAVEIDTLPQKLIEISTASKPKNITMTEPQFLNARSETPNSEIKAILGSDNLSDSNSPQKKITTPSQTLFNVDNLSSLDDLANITEPSSPESSSTEAVAGSFDRTSSPDDPEFRQDPDQASAIAVVTQQMRQYCEELKNILHPRRTPVPAVDSVQNVDALQFFREEFGATNEDPEPIRNDLETNTAVCNQSIRRIDYVEEDVVATVEAGSIVTEDLVQVAACDVIEVTPSATEHAVQEAVIIEYTAVSCEPCATVVDEKRSLTDSESFTASEIAATSPSLLQNCSLPADDSESRDDELPLPVPPLSTSEDREPQPDELSTSSSSGDLECASLTINAPTVCVLGGNDTSNPISTNASIVELQQQQSPEQHSPTFVSETGLIPIEQDSSSSPSQLPAQANPEQRLEITNGHKSIDDVDDTPPEDKLIPGSVAERDILKWRNASPIANNPYSPDVLQKRLSDSGRRSNLPDYDRLISKELASEAPIEPLCTIGSKEDDSPETDRSLQSVIGGNPTQYLRYGRDYYVNDAKRASGSRKQLTSEPKSPVSHGTDDEKSLLLSQQQEQPTGAPVSPLTSPGRRSKSPNSASGSFPFARSSSFGDSANTNESEDIFSAGRPIELAPNDPILKKATKLAYLSTPAHEIYLIPADAPVGTQSLEASSDVSMTSRADDSLTVSEDSDVTRIYEIGTGETILVQGDAIRSTVAPTITPPPTPADASLDELKNLQQTTDREVMSEEILEIMPRIVPTVPTEPAPSPPSPTIDRSNLLKPRYVQMKQLSPETIRFFAPKKPFSGSTGNLSNSLTLSQSSTDVRDLPNYQINHLHSSIHIDCPASRSVPSHEFIIEKEVMEVLPSVKELAKCYNGSQQDVSALSKPIQKPRVKLRKDFIRQSSDMLHEEVGEQEARTDMPHVPNKNRRMYCSTSSINAADEIREIRRLNLETYNRPTFVPMAPGHSITARSLSKQIREELKTNATDDTKGGHVSPERPSSPVFIPGHLRSSVQFFESLRKK